MKESTANALGGHRDPWSSVHHAFCHEFTLTMAVELSFLFPPMGNHLHLFGAHFVLHNSVVSKVHDLEVINCERASPWGQRSLSSFLPLLGAPQFETHPFGCYSWKKSLLVAILIVGRREILPPQRNCPPPWHRSSPRILVYPVATRTFSLQSLLKLSKRGCVFSTL